MDSLNNSQNTALPTDQQSDNVKKPSLSPWDDDLPEETPAEKIVGSFSSSVPNGSVLAEQKPFQLPNDVEKGPLNVTTLPPQNLPTTAPFVANQEVADPVAPSVDAVDDDRANGSRDILSDLSDEVESPTGTAVQSSTVNMQTKADTMVQPEDQVPKNTQNLSPENTSNMPNNGITANDSITAITSQAAPVNESQVTMPSVLDKPADPLDDIFSPTQSQPVNRIADIKPPITSSSDNVVRIDTPNITSELIQPAEPTKEQLPPVAMESNASTNQSQDRIIFPVDRPVVETQQFEQTPILEQAVPTIKQTIPVQAIDEKVARAEVPGMLKKILMFSGIGLVLIFVSLIYLTESGVLSMGLEKVYGGIGIQKLWGGLPTKTDSALLSSFSELNKKDSFKVSGSIDFTIDSGIKSDITSPLFEKKIDVSQINIIEKAVLAAFSEDFEDSEYYNDYLSETSSNNSNTTANSTNTSNTSNSTNSNSEEQTASDDEQPSTNSSTTTDSNDQASEELEDSPYLITAEDEELTTSTRSKTVSAEIEASISKNESSSSVSISGGTSGSIEMVNRENKLWVKSDDFQFAPNAESDKWLEYEFSAFAQKNIFEELTSASPDTDAVIEGTRLKNEKLGDVRCYNYQISKMEVGNLFQTLGIKSDMIQNVSGNVWIGVKDKLLRKLDLKVTLSPSISVVSMNINLELSNFNEAGKIEIPSDDDVIVPGEAASEENTETTGEGVTNEEVVVPTADETRKNDLKAIKGALEKYKLAYGRYPLANSIIKLNQSGNVLESALVPKYITMVPKDAKDSEGWYYGYKSVDGKSFSLSARLENSSDTEGVLTNGVTLYLVYNQ